MGEVAVIIIKKKKNMIEFKLRRFLSGTKVRNYLIIIASVILLVVVTILAEFGDKKYDWSREKDGVPIEHYKKTKISEMDILEMLKEIKDPEFNINIVDLGLILDTDIEEEKILINMILTTPYCPYSSTIIDDVRKTLFKYDKVNSVLLTIRSEPVWSYDRLTEDGKKAVNKFFKGEQSHEHQH